MDKQYIKKSPISSLKSNKNKKSKTVNNEEILENLKIPLKAKDKQIKNKTRKLVLENLSQTAQKENIYGNVLNIIKSHSKILKSDDTIQIVKQPDCRETINTEKEQNTEIEISSSEEFLPKQKKNITKKKKVTSKIQSEYFMRSKTLNNSSEYIIKALGSQSVDSVKKGEEIFQWLLNSIDVKTFFQKKWQQKHVLIKRECSSYYSYLLSSSDIDYVLRNEKLYFNKNINVTSSGVNDTHTPLGQIQATAPLVWDYFSSGYSVHLLNPQIFFPKIHALNAALQEYFGCFIGANVCLTPRNTQNFPPHFNDGEMFVLQIEGSKLWKLYLPRKSAEIPSLNLSENLTGAPIKKVLLEAGDLLYIPRGMIHQASTKEDKHSLHITLSMYQNNSWADFLKILLPEALKCAIEKDPSFQEALPMHYLSHLGLVHSEKTTKIRSKFLSKLQDLMSKVLSHAPVDATVDQLGKRFIHDSLPPFLSLGERKRTVAEDGDTIINGEIRSRAEMRLDTPVKLIRYNCVRLVNEENTIRVYYSIANSKQYHGVQHQYLEIKEEFAPIIYTLINSYPDFIKVNEIPVDNTAKLTIISDLWFRGIIMTGVSLAL